MLALLILACRPPDPARWTPTRPRDPWPEEAGEPIPLPPELSDQARLLDVSAWGADGLSSGRDSAGSFGLGNGVVFGIIGLDSPWSTLTNAIGPGYQLDAGFFGDSALQLWEDGAPLAVEAERAQRPRGLSVARTLAQSGDLALSTTDLAVPGEPIIARHVTVWNQGERARAGLTVRLTLARSEGERLLSDERGLLQRRGGRVMRVVCPDADWSLPDEGGLALDLAVPTLAPGESWSTVCQHVFGDTDTEPLALDVSEALDEIAERDAALLDRAVALNAPEPKVADLLEGLLLTLQAQTAESGLVSPMSRYTSGWLRDAEGPVRLYLAAGLHEEARTQLDVLYETSLASAEISNSFPLDVDLSTVEEPADPETFWSEVPFMEGRGAAEAPSVPVLLHAWYVRNTGDASIITEGRLAWLEACLSRQDQSDEGLLPWSGDETWRWPFALASGVGLPEEEGWSLASGLLYVAATDALLELGGDEGLAARAERAREALETVFWQEEGGFYSPYVAKEDLQPYLYPYEDASLLPLWLGGAGLQPERLLRNLGATREALLREDGALASEDAPGTFVGTTGMVQPMWLSNLVSVHADGEEAAWDALDLLATPSGHVEELHGPSRLPLALVHQADGLGGDVSARLRPWEGGDLGAAVLDALVGADVRVDPETGQVHLHLSPHLPHGWPELSVERLPAGDGRYTLVTAQYEEGLRAVVRREGGPGTWELSVALHGARPVAELWVDGARATGGEGPLGRATGIALGPGEEVEIVGVYAD